MGVCLGKQAAMPCLHFLCLLLILLLSSFYFSQIVVTGDFDFEHVFLGFTCTDAFAHTWLWRETYDFYTVSINTYVTSMSLGHVVLASLSHVRRADD